MGLYSAVVQDSYSAQTEAGVFIPEIWAEAIRSTYKNKLVLGAIANDFSDLVTSGGNKIHIPTYADVADAAEKTENDAVTYSASTEVKMTIDINQHYYTAAMIEDMAKVQSKYELLKKYADSMAYKLAYHVEDALEAKLGSSLRCINLDNADSTVDRVLSRSRIVGIARHLYKVNWQLEDCVLVLSNRLYASLFNLDDFVHASEINIANFPQGTVGTLMGMPVVHCSRVNTTIPAGAVDELGGNLDDDLVAGGYVVHKDALAIAYSKPPTPVAEYDMDYIAHKMVVDAIYGCQLLHESTINQARSFTLVESTINAASSWS